VIDVDVHDDALTFEGALDLEVTPTGVTPRRLPAWTKSQIDDPFMDLTVRMPSGVRLRFTSDASAIELDVMLSLAQFAPGQVLPAVFDLVVDGELVQQRSTSTGAVMDLGRDDVETIPITPGDVAAITFTGLASRAKVVEIWLPQGAVVELRSLRLNEGATVQRSVPAVARRWLHYGSSISHCMEADAPTETWPALVARATRCELFNVSFAGHCLLDQFVARTIRDLDLDLISLKLGINVVNRDALDARTFTPALHGFLDTIRDRHHDVPILVVSPIFCPFAEDRPGPNVMGPDGRYVAIDGPPELRAGSLTLRAIRAELDRVVALRRSLGDGHLYYLDGRELFAEGDRADLPDDLHPNAQGYRRMGERFVQRAFGADAPFAE